LAILGVVAFVLAACAGGDDQAGPREDSSPVTTTAEASTSVEATSPPTTQPQPEGPVVTPLPPAATLNLEVPPVDGFTYTPQPDLPVPWLQLNLPDGGEGLAFGVREDSLPVGSLIVVDGIRHGRYVHRLFDEPVGIVRDSIETDEGTLSVSNTTHAHWQMLAAVPVVAATIPEDDLGQWVWDHGDLTWIATGTMAMERWATAVIAAQQPASDDRTWDYSLVGDVLYDGLPVVQPYTYIDAPVADAIAQIDAATGGCAQRLYMGSVVAADDPAPLTAEPTDLVLRAATISDPCRASGWFDDFDAALTTEGLVDDTIGDVAVHRRDNAVVVVDGDNVYQLTSEDPATLVAMAPFITAFVTRNPPPDVTDDTTLPVGTCLYRAPPPPNGTEASRRVYAVGCTEPHQGEVFHRFEVTVAPGEPYPGDGETSRRGDEGCAAAFPTYVGIGPGESRLSYLYYYPSAQTWAIGDRAVMCILYGEPEELHRATLAGSRQ
jgi:hypothetical protein